MGSTATCSWTTATCRKTNYLSEHSSTARLASLLTSYQPRQIDLLLYPTLKAGPWHVLSSRWQRSSSIFNYSPHPSQIHLPPISCLLPMPSLPRWIVGIRGHHGAGTRSDQEQDDGSIGDAIPPSAAECYACTLPGVPAFHSTSCDRACSPEWAAGAGSSLVPIQSSRTTAAKNSKSRGSSSKWVFGRVLDPRNKRVHGWNRGFLVARALSLAIDPLFFYSLSIGRGGTPCLYMDGGLAAAVTALRTCADLVQVAHVWTQLRLAYVSKESLVVGCGKLVWDARAVAEHYLRSTKRFFFDVLVILPLPQMVFWLVVPRLIREEKIKIILTTLLLIFLFQFLPKVYHSLCTMRRMQKVTGYIFGTIWWGFALNMIAYLIASHVAGGCWYVLAIQRVASCLRHQCENNDNCHLMSLPCSEEICYRIPLPSSDVGTYPCGSNASAAPVEGIQRTPLCLDQDGSYRFGIYKWALPVVSSNSLAVKILYPIFWGLMTLSTFGNDLEPTSHWVEVIFSIVVTLSGLLLFTLLIGNIQVFLHAVMARRRRMQLRCQDMEWWMRRRQLPSRLRHRVRRYEQRRWAALRGDDEEAMIQDLPLGLRRDIKRHDCLHLIKQVPLFQNLDDLILDNLCERVRPLVFSKDEKVIREGDPVRRMIFLVEGRLESRQLLGKGTLATCTLGAGSFIGDELLSWCLRRPFVDRLPASSATFMCVDPAEAFSLEAEELKYITDHFRYKFANERLKRTARYYSSNWRTWAAVSIQLAWRRSRPRTDGAGAANDDHRRLRRYAAMFMSFRPQDHLD